MSRLSPGSLMVALALLTAIAVANAQSPSGVLGQGNRGCRCFPGDECWPSAAEWSRFNRTLSGKLIATVPIGSICHDSSFGLYNKEKCDLLKASWHLTTKHDKTSSSPMAPYFTNMSCDPFTPRSAQCVIGTPSTPL
jgi:hypothetical protein